MSNHGLAEGAGSFPQLIQSLEELGFFTGLLPFVITYTIFFFMLRKVAEEIGLGGGDDANREDLFAALLSIAFAFFTSRFIIMNPAYQEFFTQYLGRFTVLVVGFLGLLVILGWFGIELEKEHGIWGGLAALLVGAVYVVSGGANLSFLPAENQNEILAAVMGALSWSIETGIIFVFLIIGLLWWTMSDPSDSSDDNILQKMFKGMAEASDDDGSD